jgi:hypothetical protein
MHPSARVPLSSSLAELGRLTEQSSAGFLPRKLLLPLPQGRGFTSRFDLKNRPKKGSILAVTFSTCLFGTCKGSRFPLPAWTK